MSSDDRYRRTHNSESRAYRARGPQTIFNAPVYGYTGFVEAHGPFIGYQAAPGVISNDADTYNVSPFHSEAMRRAGSESYSSHSGSSPYAGNTPTPTAAPLAQITARPANEADLQRYLQGSSHFSTEGHGFSQLPTSSNEIYSPAFSTLSHNVSTEGDNHNHVLMHRDHPSSAGTVRPAQGNDELLLAVQPDGPRATDADNISNSATGTSKKRDIDLKAYRRYFKRMGSKLWRKASSLTNGFGRQSAPSRP